MKPDNLSREKRVERLTQQREGFTRHVSVFSAPQERTADPWARALAGSVLSESAVLAGTALDTPASSTELVARVANQLYGSMNKVPYLIRASEACPAALSSPPSRPPSE